MLLLLFLGGKKEKTATDLWSSLQHAGVVQIRISAVFTDDLVSLTGDPASLERFRAQLPPTAIARSPHVHGYYHGGPQMESCVQEVIADVDKGNISFPTWSDLRLPLHSTSSGAGGLLNADACPSASLLEVALRHILVDVINWQQTWAFLEKTTLSTGSSTTCPLRLVFLGPSTTALRLSWNTLQVKPDVKIKTGGFVFQGPASSTADDIAIVGMSINFPCGQGGSQFWETLKNAKSAVSDVSTSTVLLASSGMQGTSRLGQAR